MATVYIAEDAKVDTSSTATASASRGGSQSSIR